MCQKEESTAELWLGERALEEFPIEDVRAMLAQIQSHERTAHAVGVFLCALQISAADLEPLGPEYVSGVIEQWDVLRRALAPVAEQIHAIDDRLTEGGG